MFLKKTFFIICVYILVYEVSNLDHVHALENWGNKGIIN